jgi:hypothetical protein
MIVTILGFIHLVHSPVLVLFPFFIQNNIFDIIYVIYFFFIMFLYTFIDGECPISYSSKKIMNLNYVSGNNITHYPEMEWIMPNQKYIEYYFATMTILYIIMLLFVIYRTNISLYLFIFPFVTLFIYFLFIRKIVFIKQTFFNFFQEFTKYMLFFVICGLLTFLHYKSSI